MNGVYLKRCGIIGYATQYSLLTKIIDIKTQTIFVFTGSSSYGDIGGLLGYLFVQNVLIQNAVVIYSNENMKSDYSSGGLIGFTDINIIAIIDTQIMNSIICALNFAGGFIGTSHASQINITSSTIYQTKIFGNVMGIVVGQNVTHGIFNIQFTNSIQIYINSILQSDCGSLSNAWSITQC
ncbi:Hypothetical_protein [Hexamita inflata]|uniref:Hypothetical_protein n=1 Tax=Hexamita inflata TaxID=28002 RepID=A0AA86U622_9EUKA|nr:Hypothetical protein HINF_LOCUS26819 [Hexamita inflata]CAI9939177.1 Hypothetical protein HINF_LOCUS26822 [Hexamita inflata]CAI9939180.1 Hypothetical protein HINF_LOCUS26825 [Hexamita inflata]